MNKPKGGRAKKAPYQSTHVRVPDELKDRVESLKELYFSGELEQYEDAVSRGLLLLETSGESLSYDSTGVMDLSQALEAARKVLKLKKSARDTVLKLLTALYGVEITLDDLIGKN